VSPARTSISQEPPAMMKLYTVEASTNVERVELALAHKGLAVEHIQVPYDDRKEVRRVSGQDLVPVLIDGDKVLFESMDIVRYLEGRYADRPRLYPQDPARTGEVLLFIDWFNRVWKRPPNEITDEMEKPAGTVDQARIAKLGKTMQGYLDLFEQILTGREYLMGEFSAADIAAFPFLKYATIHPANDPYLFHKVLMDYQKPGGSHANLVAWIARVDKRPRA
jgi:glutathione S-transferase